LLPALKALDAKSAFENNEKQRNWRIFLEDAKKELQLLQLILPCFTLIAEWVQILSASDSVTISLVRLACSKIQEVIDALHINSTELLNQNSTQGEIMLGSKLRDVVDSLQTQFDSL
jgi:hypothetical protein